MEGRTGTGGNSARIWSRWVRRWRPGPAKDVVAATGPAIASGRILALTARTPTARTPTERSPLRRWIALMARRVALAAFAVRLPIPSWSSAIRRAFQDGEQDERVDMP